MFTKEFWLAAAERAVKTFAQALAALLLGEATVLTIDWQQALAISGTAALISILTSIASDRYGNNGPSLTTETLVAPGSE